MKQKINWEKLELDYIASDIKEVRAFVKTRYPERPDTFFTSGYFQNKTQGWRDKKKAKLEVIEASANVTREVAKSLYTDEDYIQTLSFTYREANYGKLKLMKLMVTTIQRLQDDLDNGVISWRAVMKYSNGLVNIYKVLDEYEAGNRPAPGSQIQVTTQPQVVRKPIFNIE